MNLTISISDRLTPELNRQLQCLRNAKPIMAAAGNALENELRKVYREINAQRPNEKGWPRKNFWNRRVTDKIALTEVTDTSATVAIASPELIHKIEGGTVRPKQAKTLAIPANAEAYRYSPSASGKEFQFLLLAQGNLVGALLNPETYSVGKKKGKGDGKMKGGQVMYWLVRSVTHKPDPSVDPTIDPIRARLEAAVHRAASSALQRALQRGPT